MRRKRLTFIAALSLLALAALHPDAAFAAAAVLAVIVLTIFWPTRERTRRTQAEGRSADQTWPDRGMKAVLEALQEPALIVDRELLIRYRNPVSAVAFGNMALADPLSLRFRSPELLASIETAIANAVATTSILEERRPIERHWLVEVLPVPAYQGLHPSFFLVLFHDRTAERRVERMRSDFVANACARTAHAARLAVGLHRDAAGAGPGRHPGPRPLPRHHARAGDADVAADRRPALPVADRDAPASARRRPMPIWSR